MRSPSSPPMHILLLSGRLGSIIYLEISKSAKVHHAQEGDTSRNYGDSGLWITGT